MNIIIQKKANVFREKNGLSSSEPIRLKSLLIKLNILTLFRPLSDNFSGMALKSGADVMFMLINSNHSIGRQHFTIAHELYHLFEQEYFEIHQCNTGLFDKKNRQECDADFYAASLLMPESGLLDLIPDAELQNKTISIQTLLRLEQYYSVSHSAMLYRLNYLKLISESIFESFRKINIIRTSALYGYDTNLYKAGNTDVIIGDYGEKARLLYDKGKISESHYWELMRDIGIDLTSSENENGIE